MVATLKQRKSEIKSADCCWRQLPPRMRILYITARQRSGAWLTEALASDNIVRVEVQEVLGVTAGLARLRDEVFDAILVDHLPGELDALELTEGYLVVIHPTFTPELAKNVNDLLNAAENAVRQAREDARKRDELEQTAKNQAIMSAAGAFGVPVE